MKTLQLPRTLIVGGALSIAGAGTAVIGLARSVGALQPGLGLGGVLTLISFGVFFISLPTIAAAFLWRGRRWPKYVLLVVALGNLATASPEPLVLIGTLTSCGAVILSWLPISLRFAPSRRSAAFGQTPDGRWPRTAGDAYVWWALTGLVGGHLFYLRRSWQGLLYASLTSLAIISVPTATALLFLAIVICALFIDAGRIPGWASSAVGQ